MKKIFSLVLFILMLSISVKAQQQNMAGVSFADLSVGLLPGVVNISTIKSSNADISKVDITSANEYIRDYFLQDEGGRTSLGSGFIIDSKGYIVTNHHVVDGADEIMVTLADNRQFKGMMVGSDKMTDLALLKIDSNEAFPFVKMGNSDDLRVGDWILAIGNPFGLGGSVTAGIVSAKSRDIDAGSYDNFIQTDASINQGSSGGPMFNMQGEVVGINTAIFSSTGGSMGIGFATPINLSKFVVEQLMAKGKVERGWIGVKVTSNEEKINLSENQVFQGGVVVTSVNSDSPSAIAKIEAGDIIISINGNDIKDAKGFSRKIAETPPGKDIILRIWRNKRVEDITIKVSIMPEKQALDKITNNTQVFTASRPDGYIEDLGIIVAVNGNQVVVADVLADAPVIALGIKTGDIIQKIDGKDVSSIEDIKSYTAYAKTAGGPPMEIKVMSDGLAQTVRMKVKNNE